MIRFQLACLSVCLILQPFHLRAGDTQSFEINTQSAPGLWAFGTDWENDKFAGTDRWYTSGAGFSLTYTGKNLLDPCFDLLPWGKGRRSVSLAIQEVMITPVDTNLSVPDPNDMPYSGMFLGKLTLHTEGKNSYDGLQLTTGIIGPASGISALQNDVHDWIGSSKSEGWNHQLHDEPIFNLAYEHRQKYRLLGEPTGWACEAIPLIGAQAGNMFTGAYVGAQIRAGFNIPDDFGVTEIRRMGNLPPPRDVQKSGWRFYLYGGGEGCVVLRDITLDGNTFQSSPSVDKRYFVPAASFGAVLTHQRFQLEFSYIVKGDEFNGQHGNQMYNTIKLTFFF